jgi:hypothetical protein
MECNIYVCMYNTDGWLLYMSTDYETKNKCSKYLNKCKPTPTLMRVNHCRFLGQLCDMNVEKIPLVTL